MSSFETIRNYAAAYAEEARNTIRVMATVALGSAALLMTVNRRPGASTEALAAAYEHTRQTELEVDGYAKERQGPGGNAAEGVAIDRLGQHLSGDRGELEDELAKRDPTYFNPH